MPQNERLRYRALCGKAGAARLCGERSSWYLYSKAAAWEIHAVNPEARIIALVRQPADMLYSLHAHHYQRDRLENVASLEEAMALEPERRAGRCLPPRGGFPEKFRYSEVPCYSEQIERYMNRFGPHQVKVILFDDLRADPCKVYGEVLEFLGVERNFSPDFEIYNPSSPEPDTLLRRLWKTGTWRYRVRSMTPQWLRDRQLKRRKERRLQAASRQPWPPIPESLRIRLSEDFDDEITRLEALIGRDLSAWRQPGDDPDQSSPASATVP